MAMSQTKAEEIIASSETGGRILEGGAQKARINSSVHLVGFSTLCGVVHTVFLRTNRAAAGL